MKTLLLFLILATRLFAQATPLSAKIDPMPAGANWAGWRVLENTGTVAAPVWVQRGVDALPTATTLALGQFGPGTHTFVARSFAANGQESTDAGPVAFIIVVIPPATGFVIKSP